MGRERLSRWPGGEARPPPDRAMGIAMKILVVEIGGTNVKMLASGQDTPRKFSCGRPAGAEATCLA